MVIVAWAVLALILANSAMLNELPLELRGVLFQYFKENTVRLPVIFAAGIAFVLSDIMIRLFEHKCETDDI